ncbi:unnamed protein product [Linum tenue]|uniref:Aminotransferase class I/classII large domain-containing protein n=1 Tax=Linum tenue TaxID=586396 RepID=A0AAV0H0N6_9ROSI|nr:unnamed protein product [Linum tenue]
MEEKVAVFSDALNHDSIIDDIRLAERQLTIEVYVYRHCDMSHLRTLLSSCSLKKKVIVTYSMDGDFAPMAELVNLGKKHGFLLTIDDAHGTFVCGKDGGGVAQEINCERDFDICVGTLSKAAGCHGGVIACSKRWKQLIQSRGRSFDSILNCYIYQFLPVAAAACAWYMLESGFHVTVIRPPTVPSNSCRLRVTLSATHTVGDLKKLMAAHSEHPQQLEVNGYARL